MPRITRALTPEQIRSLSPDTLIDLLTPAKYFASKAIGSKKFYVFMEAKDETGKTFRLSLEKGYLTFEKAKAMAETMQKRENASIELFKSILSRLDIPLPEMA